PPGGAMPQPSSFRNSPSTPLPSTTSLNFGDATLPLQSSFADPFLPNRLDTRQSRAPCSKVSVTHAGDEPPHVTCSFPACEVDCRNRAASLACASVDLPNSFRPYSTLRPASKGIVAARMPRKSWT